MQNSNKQLMILDQSGIAFKGKVPDYVAQRVIQRYWEDEVSWWFLTEEHLPVEKLSTWIASRDWFDAAWILPPGSEIWLNIDSHYIHYMKKNPLVDSAWSGNPQQEMWLLEREDVDEEVAVHITRYILTEQEPASSPATPEATLLAFYKEKALRLYKEHTERRVLTSAERQASIHNIAYGLIPWDASEPDIISYLIADYWMITSPLPVLNPKGSTIADLILQQMYQEIVKILSGIEGQEKESFVLVSLTDLNTFVDSVLEPNKQPIYSAFTTDDGFTVRWSHPEYSGDRRGLDWFEISHDGELIGLESMYGDLDEQALMRIVALIAPGKTPNQIMGTVY